MRAAHSSPSNPPPGSQGPRTTRRRVCPLPGGHSPWAGCGAVCCPCRCAPLAPGTTPWARRCVRWVAPPQWPAPPPPVTFCLALPPLGSHPTQQSKSSHQHHMCAMARPQCAPCAPHGSAQLIQQLPAISKVPCMQRVGEARQEPLWVVQHLVVAPILSWHPCLPPLAPIHNFLPLSATPPPMGPLPSVCSGCHHCGTQGESTSPRLSNSCVACWLAAHLVPSEKVNSSTPHSLAGWTRGIAGWRALYLLCMLDVWFLLQPWTSCLQSPMGPMPEAPTWQLCTCHNGQTCQTTDRGVVCQLLLLLPCTGGLDNTRPRQQQGLCDLSTPTFHPWWLPWTSHIPSLLPCCGPGPAPPNGPTGRWGWAGAVLPCAAV